MKKYIIYSLILFVIASCKTKKTVVEQTVSQENVTDNKAFFCRLCR